MKEIKIGDVLMTKKWIADFEVVGKQGEYYTLRHPDGSLHAHTREQLQGMGFLD